MCGEAHVPATEARGERPARGPPSSRRPRPSARTTTALALLLSIGLHAAALFAFRYRTLDGVHDRPDLPRHQRESARHRDDRDDARTVSVRGAEWTGEPLREAIELDHWLDAPTASAPRPTTPLERLAARPPEPVLESASGPPDAASGSASVVTAPAFALEAAPAALDFRRAPRRPRAVTDVHPDASVDASPARADSPSVAMSPAIAASPSAADSPSEAVAGNGAGRADPPVAPAVAGGQVGHVAPRALPENAPPIYPEASRRARETGRVVIHARLDETGAVREVSVATSCGFPDLDDAARDAVRGWRFAPATVDGSPVAGDVDLPFDFVLRER